MLATECARVLGYRDSYLLFNKNRSLYKIIANQVEKDHLVQQEILPFSYRSRQIAIVTARSMFRQFGSRVIVNGRRVRDDYWETKARKQGFTEADLAGEKRPGASKAREAAEAAAQQASGILGGPHGEIIYSNTPAQFGGPPPTQLVQPGMLGTPSAASTRMPMITAGPDYNDTRRSDFSGILKQGPRQEITGPPYQDRTAPSPISEIHAQAHHAAEFNRGLNQQRDMRTNYLQNIWSRPHEQPATTSLAQPVPQVDTSVPTSRPAQSPHNTTTGLQQPSLVPNQQSPQMMMTSAAPYSQPVHAQSQVNQASMRGSSGTLPQATSSYNYTPQNQMWPPTPPTPQHGYSAYTAQPQSASHHQQQQSGVPQLRHSSSSTSQVQQGSMPYSGLPGMGQSYGAPNQGLYSNDQTPRQYSMHQTASAAPTATQSWSQPQQAPAQWWTNQPQ
jgi:chromatin structure-remodeling complex protein RSC7